MSTGMGQTAFEPIDRESVTAFERAISKYGYRRERSTLPVGTGQGDPYGFTPAVGVVGPSRITPLGPGKIYLLGPGGDPDYQVARHQVDVHTNISDHRLLGTIAMINKNNGNWLFRVCQPGCYDSDLNGTCQLDLIKTRWDESPFVTHSKSIIDPGNEDLLRQKGIEVSYNLVELPSDLRSELASKYGYAGHNPALRVTTLTGPKTSIRALEEIIGDLRSSYPGYQIVNRAMGTVHRDDAEGLKRCLLRGG